jgi:hypothetical protein
VSEKDQQAQLEEAIKKLPPEEAALLLKNLERALTKRKIQLTGYLVAIVAWFIGMLAALVIYGSVSGFVGYVFIVPFALVGLTLWGFGKWADKYSLPKAAASPQLPAKG